MKHSKAKSKVHKAKKLSRTIPEGKKPIIGSELRIYKRQVSTNGHTEWQSCRGTDKVAQPESFMERYLR